MGLGSDGVTTPRLAVRPPREADRARFVELFRDQGLKAGLARILG